MLYKLTEKDGSTRGGTCWGPGVTHEAPGAGPPQLCTDTVIHIYRHPLLAVLGNPTHANILNPRLWECDDEDIVVEDAMKAGVKRLTTRREIPLPIVTIYQRVRWAILVVKRQKNLPTAWTDWADSWLANKRTAAASAWAAWAAAGRAWAASAAAWAAGASAASAASAAAWAVARAVETDEPLDWQTLVALAEQAIREEPASLRLRRKETGDGADDEAEA